MNNFYRGVVESNIDEKYLGRVQVRIIGIHDTSKENVPTESLPWCEVVQGTSMGGITSGVGVSSVLVVGTWVWVFFEQGDWNKPVVFGTMIGQMEALPEDGFVSDDNGEYIETRIGLPDLNPLTRAVEVAADLEMLTPLTTKTEGLLEDVETASGETWSEPESLSKNASYPFNNVIETHSGHIIEIDDTSDNERIHILHKTGSYIEILPDGSIVAKSVLDNYNIVGGNDFESIIGNQTSTVTGNTENKVTGTHTEVITGAVTRTYEGGIEETITGDIKQTSDTSMSIESPKIKIGNGTDELLKILSDTISELTQVMTPTAAGPMPFLPNHVANFTALKTKLDGMIE